MYSVSVYIIGLQALLGALLWFHVRRTAEMSNVKSVMRLPLADHLSESLRGVTTIRAFIQGTRFEDKFEDLFDASTKVCLNVTTLFTECYITCSLLIAVWVLYSVIISFVMYNNITGAFNDGACGTSNVILV